MLLLERGHHAAANPERRLKLWEHLTCSTKQGVKVPSEEQMSQVHFAHCFVLQTCSVNLDSGSEIRAIHPALRVKFIFSCLGRERKPPSSKLLGMQSTWAYLAASLHPSFGLPPAGGEKKEKE